MIFDFTRLSDSKRALFIEWLLEPHQKDKEHGFLSGVYVNEYRGFTAEVALSWWGILKNWLFNNKSEHWKITDLGLSVNYQLTGIEMCHGKQGILIGFNQFLVPPSGTKYRDPNDSQSEPLGNVKRVFITDKLVDELVGLNYKKLNYESVCKSPHPQSIDVTDPEARHKDMYDYRKMQRFNGVRPWYIRLWRWISKLFFGDTYDAKKQALQTTIWNYFIKLKLSKFISAPNQKRSWSQRSDLILLIWFLWRWGKNFCSRGGLEGSQ